MSVTHHKQILLSSPPCSLSSRKWDIIDWAIKWHEHYGRQQFFEELYWRDAKFANMSRWPRNYWMPISISATMSPLEYDSMVCSSNYEFSYVVTKRLYTVKEVASVRLSADNPTLMITCLILILTFDVMLFVCKIFRSGVSPPILKFDGWHYLFNGMQPCSCTMNFWIISRSFWSHSEHPTEVFRLHQERPENRRRETCITVVESC